MVALRRDLAEVLAGRHHEWLVHLPPDWYADALCAQTDPAPFYPESKGKPASEAKKTCALCSVRQQCLDYALDNGERYGIWGGLSERERRKVARLREAS